MTEHNGDGGMTASPHKQGGSGQAEEVRAATQSTATLGSLGSYYESYYGSLMKQAMGMLGSADAAHEAIQEAVTDVAQQITDGTEIRNIGAYLRVALRFRCLRLRSRNHEPLPLEAAINIPSERPTAPADIFQLRQNCWDFYRAADQLPSAQRSAFLMAEVRGDDYHTIAASLGRSEHAVRQLLVRARHRVREAIDKELATALAPLARLKSVLQQAFAPPLDALVAGALLVAVTSMTAGPQTAPSARGAGEQQPLGRAAQTATAAVGFHSNASSGRATGSRAPVATPGPQAGDGGSRGAAGGEGKTGNDGSGGSRKPTAPGFSASNDQEIVPTDGRQPLVPGDSPIVPLDSPCSEDGDSCSRTGDVSQVGAGEQVGVGGRRPGGDGSSGGGEQGGFSPGSGSGGEQGGAAGGSSVSGDGTDSGDVPGADAPPHFPPRLGPSD